MRKIFLLLSIALLLGIIIVLILNPHWLVWFVSCVIVILIIVGYVDFFQKEDNIRRQYPLIGRLSRVIEEQRHAIQEVVLQSSTEGKPFTWIQRSIVYKRSADNLKNFAFGTEIDYHLKDRTWFKHSLFPSKVEYKDIRITIGGTECKQPYSASIFNISGMSFGSISSAAVMALNGGAAIGNFAHNTGEGGLTPYHEQYGGDLIFQIGTGYFGCRNSDGKFDPVLFTELSKKPSVKMIEIKISQGAKPGFGAILPASKNTSEIARYRKISPHKEVHSPPYHSTFNNARELIRFVNELRMLSGGKPIGVKFCLGNEKEIETLCRIIKKENSAPDYIVVDGGEGGTGAGSIDAIHWVGYPLERALRIVDETFRSEGIREKIKIFASGKIITSYDIIRLKALGADAFYSARGMMFALGCVQSLKCNRNTCPTGITTMDSSRVKALVVEDKKQKVANYHKNTIYGVNELLAAAKINNFNDINSDFFEP